MFMISGIERGGAENQLIQLSATLVDRGWAVTVLSFLPASPTSFASMLQDSGVTLVTLRADTISRKAVTLMQATQAVRRFRPDVLVGFMFHGMIAARVVGRIARIPVIVSSFRNERDAPRRETILRLSDRLSHAVTVNSPAVAGSLVRLGVATNDKLTVVPNAIDFGRFVSVDRHQRLRAKLGLRADEFLWLAVGRLDRSKDYPNLVRAFKRLTALQPDARLAIAGEGALEPDVRRLIRDLDLVERVTMLGLRVDMPEIYQACDALVLSSAWEGMPNVVLEAMASKIPVVATNVGGVSEVVRDGHTGFVVPPGDHVALSDAMVRMMALPEDVRRSFGESGYAAVRSEFSIEKVVDQWEDLFKRLLRDKGVMPGGQGH